MKAPHRLLGALLVGCSGLVIQACRGGSSDAGLGGTFTSVGSEGIVAGPELSLEFKPGGTVVMDASGVGQSSGTYTVDGEKIIVSIDNQQHTFVLDGNCLEEPRRIFGKLCKGGRAGAESNVSTRQVPTTPEGTYVATNADGEFKLTFKPGNTLTLSMTRPGGTPDTQEGTFTIEGDKIYATLAQSTPMVLMFVNGAYESTALGLPMKFVRQ